MGTRPRAFRRLPRPLAGISSIILAIVLSGVAYAATGDYVADGVNIRNGPGTSYTSLGLGYIGQGACIYYDVQGEGGLWRYHTNRTTSVTGYSWRYYVEVTDPYQGC